MVKSLKDYVKIKKGSPVMKKVGERWPTHIFANNRTYYSHGGFNSPSANEKFADSLIAMKKHVIIAEATNKDGAFHDNIIGPTKFCVYVAE